MDEPLPPVSAPQPLAHDAVAVGLSTFAEPATPLPQRPHLKPFARGLLVAPALASIPVHLVLNPQGLLQGYGILNVLLVGFIGAIFALAGGIPAFLILRKAQWLSRRSLTVAGAVAGPLLPVLLFAALGVREPSWLRPWEWVQAEGFWALLWLGGASAYIAARLARIPARHRRQREDERKQLELLADGEGAAMLKLHARERERL